MLFFLGLGCLRESGQAGASRVGANTGELSNTGKEALTNGEADKKKAELLRQAEDLGMGQ